MTATPSRPLAGRRVLVTRATGQAAPLSQELRQLGAAVVEIPAIAIQPVASPEELRAAARSLRGHRPPRWMAVTSSNAAEALRALSLPEEMCIRDSLPSGHPGGADRHRTADPRRGRR